jgi:hypothetical protein
VNVLIQLSNTKDLQEHDENTQKNGRNLESVFINLCHTNGIKQIKKTELDKYILKKVKKEILDKDGENYSIIDRQERDFIVQQPFGSQNFPDFLFFYNYRNRCVVIPIECKTSSKNIATWNNNCPKQNAVYIFHSKGKTIFFKGSSIITSDDIFIMKNYTTERKKILTEYNDLLHNRDYKLVDYFKYEHSKNQKSYFQKREEKETECIDFLSRLKKLQ